MADPGPATTDRLEGSWGWASEGRTDPTTRTIEISDDLVARIDDHRQAGETIEEFLEDLVAVYETEGAFLQEGYTE